MPDNRNFAEKYTMLLACVWLVRSRIISAART